MKALLAGICLCTLAAFCCMGLRSEQPLVKEAFGYAGKQLTLMLQAHPDTTKIPFSVKEDGSLKDMPSSWWCSGFFPGNLWYLYEYTKQDKWKQAAALWTAAMQKEQYNTSTHDLGFMLYCSYGNGLRLTGDTAYRAVLLNGAKSLASRFDPAVGLIKSWDGFEGYQYPVIIDNMMNLELLFWATKETGDSSYYHICVQHANNTLKHHFRPDNSCYHVICYDANGKVLAKKNHQGYTDASAWSRGQAWALYGYTVMYRETKQRKYLEQAEKVAAYFLQHPNLPADKVPYWDFNAPAIPKEEKDVSAAAVVASALLELSQYSAGQRAYYISNARQILKSLASPAYRATPNQPHYFLLAHSVGSKTLRKEVDQPLVYADYYYLEALLRLNHLP